MGWRDAPVVEVTKLTDAPVVGEAQQEKPSLLSRTWNSIPPLLRPVTGTLEAMKQSGELIDKAAYAAGGKVTDITGSPEAGGITNALVQAVPMAATGNVTKLGSPALQDKARSIMQQIIKPSQKHLETGKAARAIETMLKQNIPPTQAGKAFMEKRASQLEKEIQDILTKSPGGVNAEDIAIKSFTESLAKVRHNLSVEDDAAAIAKSVGSLLEHPLVAGQGSVHVATANRIKQAIYKSLDDVSYGRRVINSAEEIAEKALGRNIKEGIGAAEPKVVPTLAEQSEIINALKVAGPKIDIRGNTNTFGLGSLSPNLANLVVWLADRSPWFRNQVAQTLYHSGGAITGGTGATAGAVPGVIGQITGKNE